MTFVPSVGPKDAKIVILGEAPGATEVAKGEPFVGPSGKLLTTLMAQAGILRGECYLTNVVKERPTGNDITEFIDLTRKEPKVSEKGKHYLIMLEEELKTLNPNVVVPTGNVSLWALTGNKGITKWRGSVLEGKNGLKIIPTIHPAAALRQFIFRYYILNDFKRVRYHSRFPEVPPDHRNYILRPSLVDCHKYLDECLEKPLVAFDIEVSQGEVSCISFAHTSDSVISIPFTVEKEPYFLLPEEVGLWKKIAQILEHPNVKKLGHNLAFDCTFLYRRYGIRSCNLEDTMIAQGILHPDFRKALQYVTSWYTTLAYYKDEGKAQFKSQDNEDFWRYNAKDSVALMEAFPQMMKELKFQGNYETYKSQCELILPLTYMTELGINVDQTSMQVESALLSRRIKELEAEINKVVTYEINPRSVPQLLDYFYTVEKYPPYKNPKTGHPTVDEKALKRLSRKGAKVAFLILELREIVKLKSTYLDVKLGNDGRLRGSYNPIGTTTLRLSSSADIFGVGTNLQNLPPRMKVNLRPDPKYIAFEVDLAQAENRVVAYIGPDQRMIEAFEEGRDIHSETAGHIFGKDPNEIKTLYTEYEAVGKPTDSKYCPDIGQGNKPFRYWGKEANHAFNYGLGYKSAALRWEIPEKDAKHLYEAYHRIYPGVRLMHRWIKNSLNKSRTVSNLFGFKRQFLDQWTEIVKDAYAFVAQSTVAEVINRHGLKYIYYSPKLFPHLELLNQVHDSIEIQIPLEIGWEEISTYLNLIKTSLETPLEFRGNSFVIPTEVTMHIKNLSEGFECPSLTALGLEAVYQTNANN